MSLISDFGFLFFIILTSYSKYAFTIDSYNGSLNKKESITDQFIKNPSEKDNFPNKNEAIHTSSGRPLEVNLKEATFDHRISEFSLEGGGIPQQIPTKSELGSGVSEISLEGGGTPQKISTTLINNGHVEPEIIDEEIHLKGSKGRKGVGHEGSSVVPRKGVDDLETKRLNSTLPGDFYPAEVMKDSSITSSGKTTNKSNITEVKQNSTNQSTPSSEEVTQKMVQAKKPEVVSDIGDANDFDTYTIIKTSTTGEDYVIIGIVIVIGIWFSVFGALIFYRRAGEYWDRRHYRRMDFLVEGMYND